MELPEQIRRALSSLNASIAYLSGVDAISPDGRRGECIELKFEIRPGAGKELVESIMKGSALALNMRAYVELIKAGRAGSTFRVLLVPSNLLHACGRNP